MSKLEFHKMCVKFWEVIGEMDPNSEYNLVGRDENGKERMNQVVSF